MRLVHFKHFFFEWGPSRGLSFTFRNGKSRLEKKQKENFSGKKRGLQVLIFCFSGPNFSSEPVIEYPCCSGMDFWGQTSIFPTRYCLQSDLGLRAIDQSVLNLEKSERKKLLNGINLASFPKWKISGILILLPPPYEDWLKYSLMVRADAFLGRFRGKFGPNLAEDCRALDDYKSLSAAYSGSVNYSPMHWIKLTINSKEW